MEPGDPGLRPTTTVPFQNLESPIPEFPHVTRSRPRAGPLAGLLLAALVISGYATARAADPPVVVTLEGLRLREGHEGETSGLFTLRLSRAPGSLPGSVAFMTQDRGARAGTDYAATAGVIAFNDSDLVYPIKIAVFGDTLVEGNERFLMRLSNPSAGFVLADSAALGVIVNDERARFRWVAAGLTPYYVGNLSPAFGYADEDMLPDLPLSRNLGGGLFEHHAGMDSALIWGNHHGSAWCDYDRDGRQDLVITPYAQGDTLSKLQLLRNFGNGHFEDVAPAVGMDVIGRGETPVWGDFDGDGWPDLFVPYYADLPPWKSFLWRNNQNGTFTDISAQAGVDMTEALPGTRPEGADAVDWNHDGSLDLYCAQRLFLNDGHGVFTDVREQVGLPGFFDEGSRFVDVDGDGDFELYLRTIYGPKLFRNDKGQYVEITAEAGLPLRELWWGDSWADVDNDGDLDLLLMHAAPAELYLNDGAGVFESDSAFLALEVVSALSAWADVDLDGDLDVTVGASGRELLINDLDQKAGAQDGVLRVWILDAEGRRSCPGTVVRLHDLNDDKGSIQTRVVDGGSGYLTQSEYPLHFAGLREGTYRLGARYPGSVHSMTVVDGRSHPMLEGFNPGEVGMGHLFVYRDGHLSWQPQGPPTSLAVPAPPRSHESSLQAWPSPARGRLSIRALLEGRDSRIDVHDLTGRRVRELGRGAAESGPRQFEWDLRDGEGREVANGVYFVRLVVDGRAERARRIVVLR